MKRARGLFTAAMALGVFACAGVASADGVTAVACSSPEDHCERAAIAVSKESKIVGDYDYDSGWIPANSPLQVRLVSFLHGRTKVDMAGTLDATWPEALRLRADGTIGQGALSIDDGLDLQAMGRIHVTVAGTSYDWEGNLPYVPSVTIEAQNAIVFDPWAWKGGGAPPFVDAKTARMTFAQIPLTEAIIPIPGVSGGFNLDGELEFSASYVTTSIAFNELIAPGSIPDETSTASFTRVLLADGTNFDTTVTIHGEMTRQTTLHFIPALYVSIAGSTFELPLVDLPAPLPAQTAAWDFDPVSVHIPLPRIDVQPKEVDLGDVTVNAPVKARATLFDLGQAKLVLDASADPKVTDTTIETTHYSIDGGYSAPLSAVITPTVLGAFDRVLTFVSNDPRQPTRTLHVKGVAVGAAVSAPAEDAPTASTGGCACEVGDRSSNRTWIAAFLGLFVIVARRKRR